MPSSIRGPTPIAQGERVETEMPSSPAGIRACCSLPNKRAQLVTIRGSECVTLAGSERRCHRQRSVAVAQCWLAHRRRGKSTWNLTRMPGNGGWGWMMTWPTEPADCGVGARGDSAGRHDDHEAQVL